MAGPFTWWPNRKSAIGRSPPTRRQAARRAREAQEAGEVSGRPLITITSTSDGLDFEVQSQAMQAFLDPYEVTRGSWTRIPTSEEVESLQQLAKRRRSELAGEFRALARKLELGEWPFANDGTPDPHESRGAAEREIDALAEHIQLQERE